MAQSNALNNVYKLNDLAHIKEPRFGAKGNGVDVDTAAFTAAAATGKIVVLPVGTYIIDDVVSMGNMIGSGDDDAQTTIKLTSSGQLKPIDEKVKWTGIRIETGVNSKTMVKVPFSYFSFDQFTMAITGGATGVTGIEFDTTTDIYQCKIEPNNITGVAVVYRVTGTGSCNNNKLGDDNSYAQTFTTLLSVENSGGSAVFSANTINGYAESGTNLLVMATGANSLRDNKFNVWPDTVTNTINAAAGTTVSENAWTKVTPGDYVETGSGTINAQIFERKANARVYLGSDMTGVADETDTKVQFNTESWDVGACYDNATNYRWTAKRAAKIRVYSQGDVSGNLADADRVLWQIFKNNALNTQGKQYVAGGTNGARPTVQDTISVIKGDYIEIFAYANETAGANTHTIAGGATTTYLTIEEV